MKLCDSCEEIKNDTKPYLLEDDLHGNRDVKVYWCDECRGSHTKWKEPGLKTTPLFNAQTICAYNDIYGCTLKDGHLGPHKVERTASAGRSP